MVVRALSNLEEKLHQSFFLYVLPSASTFVSVGEYFYTVALAISPAIAHMLYLASQTSGMRVAFGMAVFVGVEALCVLLLVGVCSATPTESLQNFGGAPQPATRWWSLAIAISVAQALAVVAMMPALRSITGFSGCVEIHDWKKKVATYEAEQQAKLAQEENGEGEAVAQVKPSASQSTPQLDSGWRSVKCLTMAVLVYVS